jgi:aryl-alcohol dehydrogenase-like predicted oxidoreductase
VEYLSIPEVAGHASRLVMGTVHPAPALWESFLEAGGTCFDTARHYGDETEAALGQLVERLGVRDSVVVFGKGGHPPDCRPEAIPAQLDRSLELLRTDRVDVYLLHRDDPSVPVGEFVDALHDEVRAGRTSAVGLSNWTTERFDAFNAHAAREGKAPAVLLSNQLSLAEMLEPIWPGCLRADTGWHERRQTTLLAWSAQARGFFAGRKHDDELSRSWLSSENLQRRSDATALAGRLGVPAVAVAVAWVLARPFPTLATIGPRDHGELTNCLAAVDLKLGEEELAALAVR